ncbi:MAG: toll/interleukin-1 receptor domain-containing protein [Bacteroidia bacterium]
MIDENKINVFISYSWDSKEHQKWVLSLADKINAAGANTIVDRTHLKYGGHIKTFMLKSILETDIVLIILTPNYKLKADMLQGGAGYEYNIINDELFNIIKKNEKYIPLLRDGDLTSSVTTFLKGFNCADLRDGTDYEYNLKQLITQILQTPLKQPADKNTNTPVMETQFKPLDKLILEMNEKSLNYFNQLFIKDNEQSTKKVLEDQVKKWEKEIREYNDSFNQKFSPSKMLVYEDFLEDFKNNIFAKELWTVGSAIRTHDPDLARYKKDYRNANAEEIYDTVNDLLTSTHQYIDKLSLDYENIKTIEELCLDYLNEKEMSMKKVIGFGIRSELLHRYYPASFPIMTQKSLWAMYFICDSANEFITIEQQNRKGMMRVSHNWQYPYDRFTFLMNALANELTKWLSIYDIQLLPEYRFGYVNMFLSAINDMRKADIKLLHEWAES